MAPAVPAHVTRAELTTVIERDGDGFVALCPEVDVASQGSTVQEARANLTEALELFFETASESEIMRRLRSEVYVTRIEVPVRRPQPSL
ncbi:MAG: type II toxin-antitoxin system HicB family antitoxin [Spirochaetaceae bacterium]|nr:type II toxin-antitoxin system HicB family antitoxin [Spirochaetaceae bacterium]